MRRSSAGVFVVGLGLVVSSCSRSNDSSHVSRSPSETFSPSSPSISTRAQGGPHAPQFGSNNQFDVNGNLVAYTTSQGHEVEFSYNASNQLVRQKVTVSGVVSDFQILRSATGTKLASYSSTGEIRSFGPFAEIKRDSPTSLAKIRTTYGEIETSFEDQSIRVLLQDYLGSVIGMASENGVEELRDYLPFGRTFYETDASETDVSFTGMKEEGAKHTGDSLLDHNARHMTPGEGAFPSIDTITWDATSLIGHNGYTYAANDPVNFSDPTGHEPKGMVRQNLNQFVGGGPDPFLEGSGGDLGGFSARTGAVTPQEAEETNAIGRRNQLAPADATATWKPRMSDTLTAASEWDNFKGRIAWWVHRHSLELKVTIDATLAVLGMAPEAMALGRSGPGLGKLGHNMAKGSVAGKRFSIGPSQTTTRSFRVIGQFEYDLLMKNGEVRPRGSLSIGENGRFQQIFGHSWEYSLASGRHSSPFISVSTQNSMYRRYADEAGSLALNYADRFSSGQNFYVLEFGPGLHGYDTSLLGRYGPKTGWINESPFRSSMVEDEFLLVGGYQRADVLRAWTYTDGRRGGVRRGWYVHDEFFR